MKHFLVVTELGLILLDEKSEPISKFQFSEKDRARNFLDASSGVLDEPSLSWLKQSIRSDDVVLAEPQIVRSVSSGSIKAQAVAEEEQLEISRNRPELIVRSGLAVNREQAEDVIRDVSMAVSSLKIKELSANPDLQAMEAVQALDETDKIANILSARVREWYGLHFPELTSWIDDNVSLMKIILKFKSRSSFSAEDLEAMGYSKNKSKAIDEAAKESRGADLRDQDLERIVQLAEETQHLFSLRDKLSSHVEKTMRQVAPNVSEVAGPSIGARLIARAGGLRKLAIMPASTIQILGAEKALYRALKSGARPPKHGILFQHDAVHSAPKWQRGKIARSVAGKIAIAARIDTFRGTRDENIAQSLQTRLDEIKEKYKDAPKENRPQREFRPPPRREFARDGRRPDHGGKRRDRRPGRSRRE
ncbi:MAG: NOP5/NOP56 family protein [Nitrososphaerales archaeon]